MYGIAKFSEHYVTADTRRKNIKTPSWFKCPTDTPEVVVLIHGHPDGLAHLGVWERLQCWAVRNWKTEGWFVTVGRPMSVSDIALHTGLHGADDTIQTALDRLMDLGWVIQQDALESPRIAPSGSDHIGGVSLRSNEETPGGTILGRSSVSEPQGGGGVSGGAYIEEAGGIRAGHGHDEGMPRREKRKEEETRQQGVNKSRPRRSRIQWSDEDGWKGITEADRQTWLDAYAGIDIDCELAKMTAWLRANPSKANKKQWGRFVNGWLSRTQNQKVANARPVESTGWAAEAAQGM